ncbi:MAG: WecB/TagA/CpsF family glycosyltransferase [Planctomycetaceae bacterium]
MAVAHSVELFGMELNACCMDEAVAEVLRWVRSPENSTCRYVVTPNVNHAVLFQKHAGLCRAYESADLVLADGAPLVFASRLLGKGLPERVAGSDLVPALFSAASPDDKLRVFLLGGAPGVPAKAAENTEARWPGVEVVGTYSPPFGFENDEAENQEILRRISEVRPDVLVVGFGAPKQELWVHKHREQIDAKAALCVGATIDFLAGNKPRAPKWMRHSGLEWVHRIVTEPRRLIGRYVHDGLHFPHLVWRDWRKTRTEARERGVRD